MRNKRQSSSDRVWHCDHCGYETEHEHGIAEWGGPSRAVDVSVAGRQFRAYVRTHRCTKCNGELGGKDTIQIERGLFDQLVRAAEFKAEVVAILDAKK